MSNNYRTSEIDTIRDKHGKICPPYIKELLRSRSIVTFGCGPDGLDWDTLEEEMKNLPFGKKEK
jgi:hypothetical protein